MLRDFIEAHRGEILTRTRLRAELRTASASPESPDELRAFLDQLSEELHRASMQETVEHAALEESAARYGQRLFAQGNTLAQVVHAYGDFCQIISGLAVEKGALIPASELQTLGACLDVAIAGALTEHARQCERAIRDEGGARLGAMADEMHGRLTALVSDLDAAKLPPLLAEDSPPSVERKPETLCVVDRDPHVRRLVQQFVGEAYVVAGFDDGYSALESIRKSAPAVLVTEILVPGIDGLALCRLLKADPLTLRIPILVSSVLAAGERARKSGADAFLEKPLERKRFVASLRGLPHPRRSSHATQEARTP